MEASTRRAEPDKSQSQPPVLCERCACAIDNHIQKDRDLGNDFRHLPTALTPSGNAAMPAPSAHPAASAPTVDEVYDQWVSDLAKQPAVDNEPSAGGPADSSIGGRDYKPLLGQADLCIVEDVHRPGGMPVAVKTVEVASTDPRVFGIWFAADLALRVLAHPSSVEVLVRIARYKDPGRSAAQWETGVKGFLTKLRQNFPTICITGRAAASTADIAGNRINLDKSIASLTGDVYREALVLVQLKNAPHLRPTEMKLIQTFNTLRYLLTIYFASELVYFFAAALNPGKPRRELIVTSPKNGRVEDQGLAPALTLETYPVGKYWQVQLFKGEVRIFYDCEHLVGSIQPVRAVMVTTDIVRISHRQSSTGAKTGTAVEYVQEEYIQRWAARDFDFNVPIAPFDAESRARYYRGGDREIQNRRKLQLAQQALQLSAIALPLSPGAAEPSPMPLIMGWLADSRPGEPRRYTVQTVPTVFSPMPRAPGDKAPPKVPQPGTKCASTFPLLPDAATAPHVGQPAPTRPSTRRRIIQSSPDIDGGGSYGKRTSNQPLETSPLLGRTTVAITAQPQDKRLHSLAAPAVTVTTPPVEAPPIPVAAPAPARPAAPVVTATAPAPMIAPAPTAAFVATGAPAPAPSASTAKMVSIRPSTVQAKMVSHAAGTSQHVGAGAGAGGGVSSIAATLVAATSGAAAVGSSWGAAAVAAPAVLPSVASHTKSNSHFMATHSPFHASDLVSNLIPHPGRNAKKQVPQLQKVPDKAKGRHSIYLLHQKQKEEEEALMKLQQEQEQREAELRQQQQQQQSQNQVPTQGRQGMGLINMMEHSLRVFEEQVLQQQHVMNPQGQAQERRQGHIPFPLTDPKNDTQTINSVGAPLNQNAKDAPPTAPNANRMSFVYQAAPPTAATAPAPPPPPPISNSPFYQQVNNFQLPVDYGDVLAQPHHTMHGGDGAPTGMTMLTTISELPGDMPAGYEPDVCSPLDPVGAGPSGPGRQHQQPADSAVPKAKDVDDATAVAAGYPSISTTTGGKRNSVLRGLSGLTHHNVFGRSRRLPKDKNAKKAQDAAAASRSGVKGKEVEKDGGGAGEHAGPQAGRPPVEPAADPRAFRHLHKEHHEAGGRSIFGTDEHHLGIGKMAAEVHKLREEMDEKEKSAAEGLKHMEGDLADRIHHAESGLKKHLSLHAGIKQQQQQQQQA